MATRIKKGLVGANRELVVHKNWLLTRHRAAIHLPSATAVIADLHLGYDQARRQSGEAIPDAKGDEIVTALTALAANHTVRRLVIAGDLIENRAGVARAADLVRWLRGTGIELAGIVPGNHDRGLAAHLGDLPIVPDGMILSGWRVVHGHGVLATDRLVMGHFHPCLRWPGGLSAPCYLVGRRQLILPAFSADAAGGNVVGVGRWRTFRCCAIVGDDVLDFGLLSALNEKRKKV